MKVRLGDLCRRATSNVVQKDLKDLNGDYPIYGASGFIANVNFYQQEKPYIAVVKDGAGVGRIMKLPAKSSVIGTMQYIIPNDNVHIDYLAYALEQLDLAQYSTGATIPHIFKDYQKELIPLPPLEEQRQIAAVLDKISGLMAQRRRQLAMLDQLVKARFVEMFGDPIANDRGWESAFLSDVASFALGCTPKSSEQSYWSGKIKWITPAELSDDSFEIFDTVRHITEAAVEATGLKPFPAGTVIFSTRAPIGKVAIAGCEMYCNQGFKNFVCGDRLNPVYLSFILKLCKEYFTGLGTGTTFKELSKSRLEKVAIAIPPMRLQEKFEASCRQINKSKSSIQRSLSTLDTLKKSLMQQYFG